MSRKAPNRAVGGFARAAAPSPAQRLEIARTAAQARWDEHVPQGPLFTVLSWAEGESGIVRERGHRAESLVRFLDARHSAEERAELLALLDKQAPIPRGP